MIQIILGVNMLNNALLRCAIERKLEQLKVQKNPQYAEDYKEKTVHSSTFVFVNENYNMELLCTILGQSIRAFSLVLDREFFGANPRYGKVYCVINCLILLPTGADFAPFCHYSIFPTGDCVIAQGPTGNAENYWLRNTEMY